MGTRWGFRGSGFEGTAPREQYHFIEEYISTDKGVDMIEAIFLNQGVLGSLGKGGVVQSVEPCRP